MRELFLLDKIEHETCDRHLPVCRSGLSCLPSGSLTCSYDDEWYREVLANKHWAQGPNEDLTNPTNRQKNESKKPEKDLARRLEEVPFRIQKTNVRVVSPLHDKIDHETCKRHLPVCRCGLSCLPSGSLMCSYDDERPRGKIKYTRRAPPAQRAPHLHKCRNLQSGLAPRRESNNNSSHLNPDFLQPIMTKSHKARITR